jgi:hypothetical protein
VARLVDEVPRHDADAGCLLMDGFDGFASSFEAKLPAVRVDFAIVGKHQASAIVKSATAVGAAPGTASIGCHDRQTGAPSGDPG